MIEMFFLSILALYFFPFSDALTIPKLLARNNNTSPNVLGPVSQLNITNSYISPDGYNRSSTLVNGVFPGPLIQVQKNDQLSLQVFNELTDDNMALETSIHWHGIFQRQTNWADGVSWVTQCPINQQVSFQYQFNVGDQTGTYWYHSHYATQYCDGLRGPLVIYDPNDPLEYLYDVDDATTVITLSDWYHTFAPLLAQINGTVLVDSTLINGLGRYSGGPSSPLAVVSVQQGLRYRFRVVAMSCGPWFNFTIDDHRMTIIEVDGNEVEPVDVDSIPVFAGQRYSVVVTANQTVGNYWIRALNSASGATFDGNQNMAILRYQGAPEEDPTSDAGPYELTFDEGSLHPLIDPVAPGTPEIDQADMSFQLVPGFDFSTLRFMFNDVTFGDPTVPVLLQILSGAMNASQLLPSGSIYSLPPNKTIEISFPNPTPTSIPGGPHPVHLHGHAFSVVRVSGSNTTNYVNPVRRDVVSLGYDDQPSNVTIRFVTDNPGPWFLHCHIDWHLNHGFAAVMAEATDEVSEEQIPVEWDNLCSS